MKLGLDTNVLIYAHLPISEEHEAVRNFLLTALGRKKNRFVITALVLHEFIHVVTDPRRFQPPVSMAEAIAIAQRYLGRSNIECAAVDELALRLALELMDAERLGRKRIADTLLAATLLSRGVDQLVTCNPQDYAVFDGLRVVDPRVESVP